MNPDTENVPVEALVEAKEGAPVPRPPLILPRAGDEILSPSDLSALFGVDPKTVTRWANLGKIPSYRTPGGHRRFNRADVEASLRNARG